MDLTNETWAIEPHAYRELAGPMGDRLRFVRDAGQERPIEVERRNGVAIVRLDGPAVRRTEYWEGLIGGFSTERLVELCEKLKADASVDAVVLWIDSPGGEVHGAAAAAQAIRLLSSAKPVFAQVQGMAASAAYWIAIAADRVYMHAEDRVGSIGVFATVLDTSKAYEAAGVERFVAKTGELKAMGLPGTALTAEHREHIQSHVDAAFEGFRWFVSRRRGIGGASLDQACNGGLFDAKQALERRLVDGVATLEQTLEALRVETASTNEEADEPELLAASQRTGPCGANVAPKTRGSRDVGLQPRTEPPVADQRSAQPLADIATLEGLPGATSDFVVDALRRRLTTSQAQDELLRRLQDKLSQSDRKRTRSQQHAQVLSDQFFIRPDSCRASLYEEPDMAATDSRSTAAGSSATLGAKFAARVKELREEGLSNSDAVGKAAEEDEAAHRAFIAEHNARHS